MPTSNGLITARDIRMNAVKTLHIVDEAVVTAKIPDLAVTFPDKIDDPIWVTAFREALFEDTALTVYPAVFDFTTLVDVPAWVNAVSAHISGTFQLTNVSGGDVLMSLNTLVDGVAEGFANHECPTSATNTITVASGADVVGVAGSSITAGIRIIIQGASNSDNRGFVSGILVGTR